MFVLVLTLMLNGKQQIYTGSSVDTVRFPTMEACAARAKSERDRIKHLVRGEFILSCVPEESLRK